MLGGLTYISSGCKFPAVLCICAKNYENWLTVDKVIAKIVRLTFLAHPVYHVTIRGSAIAEKTASQLTGMVGSKSLNIQAQHAGTTYQHQTIV